jgi:hypothetical protein
MVHMITTKAQTMEDLWNAIVGESTLWGAHFGHFQHMYVMYIYAKHVVFNFGFTFGVWAWHFDFHKVNDIYY